MNILERDDLYDMSSDGAKINEIIIDDEAAKMVRRVIQHTIDMYGDAAISDIFDALSMCLIHLVKQPSYLSNKFRLTSTRALKFELDHTPKGPGDVYWKLIVYENMVTYN